MNELYMNYFVTYGRYFGFLNVLNPWTYSYKIFYYVLFT